MAITNCPPKQDKSFMLFQTLSYPYPFLFLPPKWTGSQIFLQRHCIPKAHPPGSSWTFLESLGKNRGSSFLSHLEQCFFVFFKSFSRVQLFATPWTMDPRLHGILQARILEWVAFPFSRGSSQTRDQTQVSHIAGRFFTS